MSNGMRIRRYCAQDSAAVRAVVEATYGKESSRFDTFAWWNCQCPVSSSGFMVAEVKNRIVGVQPMGIFCYDLDGAIVRGGILTGVSVHPEFRGQGVFTALVHACEREAWRQEADFITAMPNDRSEPGFLRLGYTVGRRRLLVHPLSAVPLAGIARSSGVFRSIARILVPGICGQSKSASQTDVASVRVCDAIPADVQSIVLADRLCFPGLRMARSDQFLKWRYEAVPEKRYKFLCAIGRQGGTTGVVVTTQEQRSGLRIGYVVDWIAKDLSTFHVLVTAALQNLRDGGSALCVAVVSSSDQIGALTTAGFWRVPFSAPVKRFFTVFKPGPKLDPASSLRLSEIAKWHQTLGDWDNV